MPQIDMADGDFIVLADHDDMMTPDALYECAKKINENPECDVLYSDEDKLDMDGGRSSIPISNQTLISICSAASIISAICLW